MSRNPDHGLNHEGDGAGDSLQIGVLELLQCEHRKQVAARRACTRRLQCVQTPRAGCVVRRGRLSLR